MSDLLRSIVSEVLKRNRAESNSQAGDAAEVVAKNMNLDLANLNRPNYQRQRQLRKNMPEGPAAKQSQLSPAVELSALQRLSTAQLRQPTLNSPSIPSNEHDEGAKLVGRTSNDQTVWYFPSPSQSISQVVGREPCGLITGIANHPSTLFIIEELLKEIPDVTWQLFGDKKLNGNLPDKVIIQSKNNRILESILKDLLGRLNRRSPKRICSYIMERPSASLTRSFNRSDALSLAVFEGLSNVIALALLDRYFHQYPRSPLHFDLREHFLLIAGDLTVVEKAAQIIEQAASQFLP